MAIFPKNGWRSCSVGTTSLGGCLGISGRRQKLQKEHQAPGDAGAELEALVHIMAAPMAPTTTVRKQVQFHT